CYKFFGFNQEDQKNWKNARKDCQKEEFGGNLVAILNKRVQAFLTFHLNKFQSDVWIGLNDINEDQMYLWTNGRGVSYTNWEKGFPQSYGPNSEDCIAMKSLPYKSAGLWRNSYCHYKRGYICQANIHPKYSFLPSTTPEQRFHYRNSSYFIIEAKMTWEDAKQSCERRDSSLASILDPFSLSYLWLKLKQKRIVWLGLNSNLTGGQYIWIDKFRMKYTKWAANEPKQKLGCVYMDLDGTWKTDSCNIKNFPLCKYPKVFPPTVPPQEPGNCPLAVEKSWIPFRGHCYHFEASSKMSWPKASLACLQLDASLVSVMDTAEATFLTEIIENLESKSQAFWIGMFKNLNGDWLWIDNAVVNFVNWNTGEPSSQNDEHCVEMFASNGIWNNVYCNSYLGYICKKPKIVETVPTEKISENKESRKTDVIPSPTHNKAIIVVVLVMLIVSGAALTDSDTFLIYNENLHFCLKLQESHSLTFDVCNKFNEWQNFKWVSDYQLLNMAVKLCLSVPSKSNMVSVTLSPCNETLALQKWECRNDTLLALAQEDLFLNPANGHENGVILSENPSTKSVWKIYETKKSLCAQKYEALFTIEGNALGAPCVFPFKYMNKWYAKCIVDDDEHKRFWYENDAFFWVKNHWTGHLYQINSFSALTWDEARKSCRQQYSELLSISELYEQAYLTGLINDFEAKYWIGLNNPDFDSGWQWTNHQPLRYFNWAPGSPSSETGKNCGLMHGRIGKWENSQCEQKHGYICKRMNSSIQAPGPSSDDLKPIKCPGDWAGYAKHCYRLNRDRKTWKDASVSCQKDGGHLLSIHDIEEYSFVFSQLGYKSTDNLWIGLNDQKTSSYFEWSDGTRVRFIRWQKGEPTLISNVQEDCVIMSGKNGYWADHFCEEELGYICKKEPSEFLPGTDEVADPKCQKGWKRYGFYCYLIGKTPGTFSEAKTSCETNQGFLISVENRFEQAFLTSQIGHRPEKYFWIGLSDVVNPGTFNWTNGDSIQFTHWNAKMPGPNPGCVAMRTGDAAGLWDVVNCEERAAFLCKHLAEGVTPPPIPRTTPPPPCPEGWIASPTRNVCFKAYDFCKKIGGDLASFHNSLEEDLLNKLSQSNEAWVGLRISDSSTGYTWTDGSPVNYIYKKIEDGWIEFENNEYYFSNTTMPAEKARRFCKQHHGDLTTIESQKEKMWMDGTPVTYEAWAPGVWNDINCGAEKSFICERHNSSVRTTARPTLPANPKGCSEGWLWFNDKCFQIFGFREEEKKNWSAARDHCRNLGGNLASIPNKAVQAFLTVQLKSASGNTWTGLTDTNLRGRFLWTDGSGVYFTNWAKGSPRSYLNDARYKWVSNWRLTYTNWAAGEPLHKTACVYLDTDGYWKTGNCSEKYYSVCERYYVIIYTAYY
ncbi:Macrophage mannose receptor 1, partial [Ophiophagus hannah]